MLLSKTIKATPVLAVLAVALPMASPTVHAQAYPVKPVRIIVTWPPGGSNDVVARVLAQRLTETLGQTFVVDNRPGATGTIGSEVAARSPADGYTIMVNSATHVANAHMYKNLPYDTLRDFTGILPLATQVGMLVVHPSLPANSVKELVALAKAKPNDIACASTGTGSYTWLTMMLLLQTTGTKMLEVNYKGGGPAVIALIAGETRGVLRGDRVCCCGATGESVRPLGVASGQAAEAVPRCSDGRGDGARVRVDRVDRLFRAVSDAAPNRGAPQRRVQEGAGASGRDQDPGRAGARPDADDSR